MAKSKKEAPKKKSHAGRKLLGLATLAGAAYVATKVIKAKRAAKKKAE